MEPTVLFVDDEPNILRALERLFQTAPVRTRRAAGGAEALDLLRDEEVAVLVSDNRMPGMEGVELLSRARLISPDTVKILLTGYADLQTAITAINHGEVFRFVTKPWDDAELTHAVGEALERYRLVRALREGDEAKLLSLAQTIELKDPYTKGHCDRVATYALLLVEGLGLGAAMETSVLRGSWLHDCGKIGVPEAILNKNGPLDDAEFAIVKRHPTWGFEVAGRAVLPKAIANIILCHHEKMDGTGYPAGLVGEAIPLEARIVAVADVFDALTTDRPYRPALSREEATATLTAMAGAHLDPQLVPLFLERLPRLDSAAAPIPA